MHLLFTTFSKIGSKIYEESLLTDWDRHLFSLFWNASSNCI